jgi:hypothetical protein
MVFIVVVFSVSLFYFTVKMAKMQVARQVEVELKSSESDKDRALKSSQLQVLQLESTIEVLERENKALKSTLRANQNGVPLATGLPGVPRSEKSPLPPILLAKNGDDVVISYSAGATLPDASILKAMDQAIGDYAGAREWKVQFSAVPAEPSPSEAKRLGYYRIASLRDYFIKQGVLPGNVENVVMETLPRVGERSTVTIKIRKSP